MVHSIMTWANIYIDANSDIP